MQPDSADTEGTIVAFDSSPDPRWPFALRQHHNFLDVRISAIGEAGTAKRAELLLDGVFQTADRKFIVLTSDGGESIAYVNGRPIGRSSTAGFACSDLQGRLILANSTVDDSWSGKITGMAVYDRGLTPQQIELHFENRAPASRPELDDKERPIALYLLDEGSGTIVHNRIGSALNLVIPKRYSVMHAVFLQSVWAQAAEASNPWRRASQWKSFALNVAGFVPLGFLFMAYFLVVKQVPRPMITTVVLGFAISLTIEIAQRFLPTRDSGAMDLVTNTLGTLIGAICFRLLWWWVPALNTKCVR